MTFFWPIRDSKMGNFASGSPTHTSTQYDRPGTQNGSSGSPKIVVRNKETLRRQSPEEEEREDHKVTPNSRTFHQWGITKHDFCSVILPLSLAISTIIMSLCCVIVTMVFLTSQETNKRGAENLSQLRNLLQHVLQGQDVINGNGAHHDLPTLKPDTFTFSFASAHKRLEPPPRRITLLRENQDGFPAFLDDSNCSLYLDVQNPDPLTEHVRNIEALSEGLRIAYSGMYYVYSSVLFSPDSAKACSEFKLKTWGHFVKLVRSNGQQSPTTVFSSYHTCGDTWTLNKETSYTGGSIYLHAGDMLSVEVSGYGLISYQKESNFIGLFMQGGEY